MRKILLITLCIFAYNFSFAQNIIKGTVLSSDNKTPLVGATISTNISGIKSATNTEGYFEITTSSDHLQLKTTFIGYETSVTDVKLPLPNPLVIYLNTSTSILQEVTVNTGYQQLPKERATGSFTQINKSVFNQQVSTNVLSRLESITNGLTFDRTTNSKGQILIRGLSTITGPKTPLIILDNFPYDGDVNNINPNDVESITILKDAAAASIWGTRAGNGVIVITTKRGHFNKPLSIELNSNVTIGQKPNLNYIKQISSSDYIDVEKMLFSNGYYDGNITDPYAPPISPVVELLSAARSGTITQASADQQINALRNVDVRNDYNKYFYQQSLNQQYSLSLTGGSVNHSWILSGGWDKDLDNLDAGYNRVNFKFQNTIRPVKNLQVTAGLNYTQSETNAGKPAYGTVQYGYGNLFPYAQFADAAGNTLPVVRDYRQSYVDTTGHGKLLNWKYYPLTDYQHVKNTSSIQNIVANFGLNYKLPLGFMRISNTSMKGNNLMAAYYRIRIVTIRGI